MSRPILRSVAVAPIILLAACSGGDDLTGASTPVRAIDLADDAACDADAEAIRAAIDQYEVLDGKVADSEAELVAAGRLSEESDLFDVSGGMLIAIDPGCKGSVPVTAPSGSAPLTAPATDLGDIVTADEPLTADEVLATMTPDDIEAFGGDACALELAGIFAAGETFVTREGRAPETLDDLAEDLPSTPTLWVLDEGGDTLIPAPGSPCPDVFNESVTAD